MISEKAREKIAEIEDIVSQIGILEIRLDEILFPTVKVKTQQKEKKEKKISVAQFQESSRPGCTECGSKGRHFSTCSKGKPIGSIKVKGKEEKEEVEIITETTPLKSLAELGDPLTKEEFNWVKKLQYEDRDLNDIAFETECKEEEVAIAMRSGSYMEYAFNRKKK